MPRQVFALGAPSFQLGHGAVDSARRSRGVVKKDDLRAAAAKWSQRAAKADLESRPVAAKRLRYKAAHAQAEANTMVRCGWTEWKPPLAPSADGARKVVWQSACRERLYDICPGFLEH